MKFAKFGKGWLLTSQARMATIKLKGTAITIQIVKIHPLSMTFASTDFFNEMQIKVTAVDLKCKELVICICHSRVTVDSPFPVLIPLLKNIIV